MEKKAAEGLKLLQKLPQHAILYTKYNLALSYIRNEIHP